MKHLLTLALFAFGLNAIAQFPNLPYNPDENGDGLIGVVDLQGLLANYGSEFSSAVLSEDGESAIVYKGDMAFPLCAQACVNLPGMWEMPTIEDLGLVWDEVHPYQSSSTWLKPRSNRSQGGNGVMDYMFSSEGGIAEYGSSQVISVSRRCYCIAKQWPRVEYGWCVENNSTVFNDCVDSYLSDGFFPLEGLSIGTDNYGAEKKTQAFWRWAE